MPRALVLEHDAHVPAGLLAEWAVARSWTLATVRLHAGERPPASLDGYHRVVSLGSEASADDESVRWQAEERRALATAVEADVPVLGICFGGQSLALALGGGVRRAARPEIADWTPIETANPGLIGPGPWFTWHDDEMLPPEGAEILAHNHSGVQAWRLGPHVALQFHPETSLELVDMWLGMADEPRIPADLRERTVELGPALRERAFALFDAVLAGTATRGEGLGADRRTAASAR
ncbi:MAG: type 1 glutamine amidotransferase [Solirubrobacteraceae bacterium]